MGVNWVFVKTTNALSRRLWLVGAEGLDTPVALASPYGGFGERMVGLKRGV